MKYVKSKQFAEILKANPFLFSRLRANRILPEPDSRRYCLGFRWKMKTVLEFAKTFDLDEAKRLYGYKGEGLAKEAAEHNQQLTFNEIMRNMANGN